MDKKSQPNRYPNPSTYLSLVKKKKKKKKEEEEDEAEEEGVEEEKKRNLENGEACE